MKGTLFVFALSAAGCIARAPVPGLLPANILLDPAAHGAAPHAASHGSGLHFSHPLIAESPQPDTKIRTDYFVFQEDEADEEAVRHTWRLEAEYAFHRTLSVELDLPYTFLDPDDGGSTSHLDTLEIALKLANFEFEAHGVLLGYGLELGLPTGDDGREIGTNNQLEIAPFLDAGYIHGPFQAVGFAIFEIPTNQPEDEEVETELLYNLALHYRPIDPIELLLELDGETVLSGEEEGETVVNLSPGLKAYPLEDHKLALGASFGFPVTDKEEFEVRSLISILYHF